MPKVKIIGMGRYLPRQKVWSFELDSQLNLPKGTVEQKSGLICRHFASYDETTSYMGAQAARFALQNAQIALTEIDAIISACGVSEQLIPCTAALIQRQLGLEQSGIACFDVNSTCLSFVSALDIASYLIDGGRFQRVLIVSSDIASAGINWKDMDTCTIFGDGAAACVLEKSHDSSQILASYHLTNSSGIDVCKIAAGGTRLPPKEPLQNIEQGLFYMEGKPVFKLAIKLLDQLIEKLLQKAQVKFEDLDWVIPHQASLLAMRHIKKRFNIPDEKFVSIFPNHGNQIAASIPTALSYLKESHFLKRGQRLLLLGTGAGLAASGIILEY